MATFLRVALMWFCWLSTWSFLQGYLTCFALLIINEILEYGLSCLFLQVKCMFVSTGKMVNVKAKVVQYVLDFPAIGKVIHVQAQGSYRFFVFQ